MRQRGVGKPGRIAGSQAAFEPIAQQRWISDVQRARQEPIPAPPLREVHQPVAAQAVRNGWPACACKNASIVASRLSPGRMVEIAPQSRRNKIVIDRIGLERRGIRHVGLAQTDTLHGGHELLAGCLAVRRRLRAESGSGSAMMIAAHRIDLQEVDIATLWWLNGVRMKSNVNGDTRAHPLPHRW